MRHISVRIAAALSMLVLALFLVTCNEEEEAPVISTTLNGVTVSYFMYQIQGLETHSAIDQLAATDYDLLIVEPGFNFTEDPYDVDYLVSALKTKPNGDPRILLAYIDVGQAEDYRDYWQNTWIAPTATEAGYPDFLITIDPEGWTGNYPVAYWDSTWQQIWLADDGLVKHIADQGFDGVYLDWVEAYDDEAIRDYAATQGKNTENEMISFVAGIKNAGKAVNPEFLVIAQNAQYLIDANETYYASIIDGLATEDTWFYGQADADWNSSEAGDLEGGERHADDFSNEARISQNKKYLSHGLPVFTVDYCVSSENAEFVYNESRRNGFIPLVTRVALSQITETPPF